MNQSAITTGSRVTTVDGLATVIAVKGRWVKIRFDHNNFEKNVGFKDVALEPEKNVGRKSARTPGEVCPKCGSKEVYHGQVRKGFLVDEEFVWGCHACGWDNLTKNGIVNPAARARYARTLVCGVVHLDSNDEVARALRGMDLHDVYKVAADVLDTVADTLRAKYQHLNNGQQRMNLGNRIRKAVKANPGLMEYVVR